MPEQSITIKFQAKGNKALTRAIRELDKATKELQNQTKKLRKQGGVLDTTFKRNQKSATVLGNTFSTLRSKMLLYSFAMSMGIRQLTKFAEQAARLEVMAMAFNSLAGGSAIASDAMEELKKATNAAKYKS